MHFRTGGPSPNSKQFNEAISHSTPSVRGPNEGANLSPFNGFPPPLRRMRNFNPTIDTYFAAIHVLDGRLSKREVNVVAVRERRHKVGRCGRISKNRFN